MWLPHNDYYIVSCSLPSKPGKKLKVKEPSYQSVSGKGGGLVRVYTALVSPFHHRVVVVCSRKSSVGEVVATSLAKCGKQDQDIKRWDQEEKYFLLYLSYSLPPSLPPLPPPLSLPPSPPPLSLPPSPPPLSLPPSLASSSLPPSLASSSSLSHRMVLVSGPASGSPAHYLDPEDKILSVKSGAPPTAMFVLCVNMPGQAPLEIIDSIRQNVNK